MLQGVHASSTELTAHSLADDDLEVPHACWRGFQNEKLTLCLGIGPYAMFALTSIQRLLD